MQTYADKNQGNKSKAVGNAVSQKKSSANATFQFEDNRHEAVAQRKLQEVMNNSPQVKQFKVFQGMANNSPQAKQAAQLQAIANNHSTQQYQPIQKKENNTGLPDNLKTGVENLSGYSMDDVKVHYNSDKPAQLNAHAYAQGTDIHLGSGQEKHLPHEAWHVVQQKQGRVKPTMQMKGKIDINDDKGLEKEADAMGAKAFQMKGETQSGISQSTRSSSNSPTQPLQLKLLYPRTQGAKVSATNVITNTDPVVTGPQNMNSYSLKVSKGLDNKTEAIDATREVYTEVGELTTEDSGFLSDTKIGKLTGVSQYTAIYQALQDQGVIPQGGVPATSPLLKAAITPLLTKANIDHLRNNSNITDIIDPFQIIVEANYGDDDKLTSIVEFTEGQKGYISAIKDTANEVDATMEDRANYAGEHPNPIGGEDQRRVGEGRRTGMVDTYSNIHHSEGSSRMGSLISGIDESNKKSKNEEGVDAYTKMIAEGGRFKCVANLGNNLTNESLFFTKKADSYYAATFKVLWGKWAKFKTEYGIEDDVVAEKLISGNWADKLSKRPPQNSKNYDLDKGAIC